MSDPQTVFVVDDDPALRDALSLLMQSVQQPVEAFDSAQAFLDAFDPRRRGCLVLDIRMPGMSGLDLQSRLNELGSTLPVIIITGHGDVPMAVRALKNGAMDFLEKPFNDQMLLDCVKRALEVNARESDQAARRSTIEGRLALLTPRERQVLELVVAGKSNKEMAADLGVSQKTIEAHRAKVMEKTRARSLSELMRMILTDGVDPLADAAE
ncbi:response regulator transcription factor [Endothiovibrio diazotrophicus]